jgi:4-hydroxybenzoate polyprenyltransferase
MASITRLFPGRFDSQGWTGRPPGRYLWGMDKKRPSNTASDIALDGFWGRLPASWQPFILLARLDRPIGWWLLLLPGWWAIPASTSHLSEAVRIMALFWAGAVVMRGAGCVINDLIDRRIDRQIARTAGRPLASGAVSVLAALLLCGGLMMVGLLVLLQLPWQAWVVGLASAPLIILYPLAKRVFGFPQLILGLVFSWAALLGPVAVTSDWPSFPALWLWFGSIFWVVGYDTIYAVQDIADDRLTGVRSSALTLGHALRPAVGLFYLLAWGFLGIGFYGLLDGGVWMAGWAAAGLQLGWQTARLELDNPQRAGQLFRSNRDAGLLLTAGLMAEFFI